MTELARFRRWLYRFWHNLRPYAVCAELVQLKARTMDVQIVQAPSLEIARDVYMSGIGERHPGFRVAGIIVVDVWTDLSLSETNPQVPH